MSLVPSTGAVFAGYAASTIVEGLFDLFELFDKCETCDAPFTDDNKYMQPFECKHKFHKNCVHNKVTTCPQKECISKKKTNFNCIKCNRKGDYRRKLIQPFTCSHSMHEDCMGMFEINCTECEGTTSTKRIASFVAETSVSILGPPIARAILNSSKESDKCEKCKKVLLTSVTPFYCGHKFHSNCTSVHEEHCPVCYTPKKSGRF